MLLSTQAIVLGKRPYSDSYSLAHLLTREAGHVTYRIPLRGGRGSVSKKLRRTLFPLAEVAIVADHRPLRTIQSIREVAPSPLRLDLITDPRKQQIAFFLAEVLDRLLRDVRSESGLYDFISQSLDMLEELHSGVENFHLYFLLRFLAPCGIAPAWGEIVDDYAPGKCFSFDEVKLDYPPLRGSFLSPEETRFLMQLLRMNPRNIALYKLSGKERRYILERILSYYRMHYAPMGGLHSTDVLAALYRDE